MKQGYLWPVLAILVVAMLPAMAARAGAAPPVCTEADTAGPPRVHRFIWPPDDKAPGRSPQTMKFLATLRAGWRDSLEFPITPPTPKYPYGSLDIYGFTLTFAVSADGRVTCASIKPAYRASGPAVNYVRQAFLEGVADWRFKPVLVDGKPGAIVAELPVEEEELPKTHVAVPVGNPAEATITYDVRPGWANFGPYHIELHGDGTAIYMSNDPEDALGPQTYHVDAKAVQALLAQARGLDFWSLRDRYRSPNSYDTAYPDWEQVNITVGGRTKSLRVGSQESGMPMAVRAFTGQVMSAARVFLWQNPTLETVETLKANDYDFHAKPAGRLLLQMTQNAGVKDDAILAVMDLGAPLTAKGDNPYMDDEYQTLVRAALGAGRVEVARRLIEGGALLSDGKTDPDKVKWAFYDAVASGKLEAVELMLPFKPVMTYRDYDADDHEVQVSIFRRLGVYCSRHDDPRPAARRLLDLGADVNAHEADGRTLLHLCDYNPDFVAFLLDHGANIEASDEEGRTPLGTTYDEDVALLLLTRGADPRQAKAARNLRFNIRENDWRKTKAWLEGHGFADVLVASPEDDAPQ